MKFSYEPSHQCKVCLKSFHLKQDLDRHMRTHSGEKPHVCSICDRRFARKQNLKTHLIKTQLTVMKGILMATYARMKDQKRKII